METLTHLFSLLVVLAGFGLFVWLVDGWSYRSVEPIDRVLADLLDHKQEGRTTTADVSRRTKLTEREVWDAVVSAHRAGYITHYRLTRTTVGGHLIQFQLKPPKEVTAWM